MKKIVLVLVAVLALYGEGKACTSAIVAANRSSEGAALLWKHRDSQFANTRVDYIADGKYAFSAIVSNKSDYKVGPYVGINEVGLGVMNTATRKLPKATEEEWNACTKAFNSDTFRTLMRYALQNCSTVAEFEEYIRSTKRVRGFNTNIGIADAHGAAAYFEIWDLGYRRYDVCEQSDGFDVRSNFSFAGDPKAGTSFRRYDVIKRKMSANNGNFTPQDFVAYSRSYDSIEFGDVLATNDCYRCENHTVPRTTSVSVAVLVCDAKNPRMLVMNGHPASSLAVPVYVKAKEAIPHCVKGKAMYRLSEKFCSKAYSSRANLGAELNKEVVRKVLAVGNACAEMPAEMPADMKSFNKKLGKLYVGHAKAVKKAMKK